MEWWHTCCCQPPWGPGQWSCWPSLGVSVAGMEEKIVVESWIFLRAFEDHPSFAPFFLFICNCNLFGGWNDSLSFHQIFRFNVICITFSVKANLSWKRSMYRNVGNKVCCSIQANFNQTIFPWSKIFSCLMFLFSQFLALYDFELVKNTVIFCLMFMSMITFKQTGINKFQASNL